MCFHLHTYNVYIYRIGVCVCESNKILYDADCDFPIHIKKMLGNKTP